MERQTINFAFPYGMGKKKLSAFADAFINPVIRCAACGMTRKEFDLYADGFIFMHNVTTVCCSDDWRRANAVLLKVKP